MMYITSKLQSVMANFFGFNSYLKLFGLSLLSLWYPPSTKVLCCLKSCTRHVCTLNLTHSELSFFFFFFLQSKRNSPEIGTQTTWGPWSCGLQLSVAAAGAQISLAIQLNQEGLHTFFQERDLCHEITAVPSCFSPLKRGWALNHHSQKNQNKTKTKNRGLCLHVELSGSTVALVVIRALAAVATCCFASLNPHNHRILNFLNHSSNVGPGALQRCVDTQCTATGILGTTRKHTDQNLDILGFYSLLAGTHSDTPLSYLVACGTLVNCYLEALISSISPGRRGREE